jgi:predicted AlkP superfamily pyrophosphatase or phosphodiesterase
MLRAVRSKRVGLAVLAIGCALGCADPPPDEPVEHVVVIGVDGLTPAGIRDADTPNIDALVAAGAHSFQARAVMPTTSAPNWASMIMGVPPEAHGILDKKWDARAIRGRSHCGTAPGRLPTNLFRLTRAQRPDADVVALYEWAGFGALLAHGDGRKENTHIPTRTAQAAVDRIAKTRPLLLFVQFVHTDNLGHRFGHGSAKYLEGVAIADEMIGRIMAALDAAGIRQSTVVIVTSDHGGVGKTHGGDTPAEILIPWIIAGPGVRRGATLADPIVTTDTAATVVALLGDEPPACWTGKPVAGAFAPGRFGLHND